MQPIPCTVRFPVARRIASVLGITCALAGPPPAAAEPLPAADQQMFWPVEQKPTGFRNLARIYVTDRVPRGAHALPLPKAPRELAVGFDLDGTHYDVARFIEHNHVAGLLVLRRGRIVLERYSLGQSASDLWASFSVAKSVMSTLLGAAIKDGRIGGLDEPVTRYIPELASSAYQGVTIRQALTMSVGVRWNEDYKDPDSDFLHVRSLAIPGDTRPGVDIVDYLAHVPRVAAPGTVFHYNSGNAELLGVLVARATGKQLSSYLSEKIWSKVGMEADARWVRDRFGRTFGSSLLSATLRDYGRFGYFFMHGAKVGGVSIVPDGWVEDASRAHLPTDWGHVSYGYQWWINPDGSYRAVGVFGQMIFLDPKRDLVIVTNSAWPEADWDPGYDAVDAFNAAVQAKFQPR